ncbi:hypothetical protein SynWH8101_2138 [Synechococcus sp. WH 8101]|nr:hypothetical protein SynWH8101_2138 [Synechococcus sp. WH 8101]
MKRKETGSVWLVAPGAMVPGEGLLTPKGTCGGAVWRVVQALLT